MLSSPRESEVSDFLPAVLAGEVAAAGELPVLGGRRRLALLLEVRLVDRRRADAVFGAGDKEQRRPRRVPVVDFRHGVRVEVREPGLEERSRRAGDVVALVDRVRLVTAERVGEAPVELVRGQRRFLFQISWIAQGGPRGSDRRVREPEDTLRRARPEGDGRSTQAAIRQELRKQPAERVADDDRRLLEPADDLLVAIDDVRYVQVSKRGRVALRSPFLPRLGPPRAA